MKDIISAPFLIEMVRTCTKLIVMKDRRKVAELTGAEVSSDNVMRAIAGGESA